MAELIAEQDISSLLTLGTMFGVMHAFDAESCSFHGKFC